MRIYPALDLDWTGGPDEDRASRVLAALDDLHPTAIEDRDSGLRVFFASPEARDAAARGLADTAPDMVAAAVDVPDEGWAERSQASLGPVRVDGLVIAPPWAANDGDVIVLPSMGFGTGHHASTRLCLRLLQRLDLRGRSVVDVGTGSGVLALAAWKLGASPIAAVDHDADAIASAAENLELNRASSAVALEQVDLDVDPEWTGGKRADVVLANLTGGMLERIAAGLSRAVLPGGSIIASGILQDEADAVQAAFSRAGLQVVERLAEEEWVGLRLTSPTASTRR